jgi:hypothetical protein
LAEWLECGPQPEDIQKFAAKYPDRYATAIRQVAQIAGFSEKREVSVDVTLNIRTLSDSQLEDALHKRLTEVGVAIPLESHNPSGVQGPDGQINEPTLQDK